MRQNQMIDIKSPLSNKVIGQVPAMTQEQVNAVIQKAKESISVWNNTSIYERVEYLYKVAELLLKNEEKLVELLIEEVGKDRKSAKSEVVRTADFIRFTADIAKNLQGQNIHTDRFPGGSKGKFAFTSREPVGVVLAISPFNYPVNLAASKIAPALVGGNTVVFKPATQGSLSGSFLAELFIKAGLPEGVLGLVTGKGSEIGDYVVTHPDINFINFTGSTEVGKHIAERAKMILLLMELGGKDAAIVLEDADLDLVADHIIGGAFSYSGQRCTAIKRVLVLEEVAGQLVHKLKQRIKMLKVGNPMEVNGDIDVVPLINRASADFVEGLNEDMIILGCPSCGVEQLDEDYMEPFVQALEGKINNKAVALFGSFGWGEGDWIREWEDRMTSFGGQLVTESLMIKEAPEEAEEIEACRAFGRILAVQ